MEFVRGAFVERVNRLRGRCATYGCLGESISALARVNA